MKKRIFSLFVIVAVAFAVMLSFASCEENSFSAIGFTVGDVSNPTFNYNEQTNTTAVTLDVKITNQTRADSQSISFFAEFRDLYGNIIDSRVCTCDLAMAPGESKNVSYEFKSNDMSDSSVIKGRVDSVTYSPCNIKVVGGSSASAVATGEESLSAFEIFLIIFGCAFCIGLIVMGILNFYWAYDDDAPVGGLIAVGVLLIVAAIIFALSYILFV